MDDDGHLYQINEIYYSLHGEGVRYGMPHVFVRFARCNLACDFCDTEHESAVPMTAAEIVAEARKLADRWYESSEAPQVRSARPAPAAEMLDDGPCRSVLFCGGEPLLQLDEHLIEAFKLDGPWFLAVETNGTREAPDGLHWITCSPKVAEHAVKLKHADELKYVRGAGQGIPRPAIPAEHHLLSPIFDGDQPDPEAMATCIDLVKKHPAWRLTVQHHKGAFGVMR